MTPFIRPLPEGRRYVSRTRNYVGDSRYVYHLEDDDDYTTVGGATAGGSTNAAEPVDAEYEAILRRTAPAVPEPLNKRTLSKFLRDAAGRGTPIEPEFLNNTEIHVICASVPDILGRGFVAHYTRFNHSLELRAMIDLPGDFFGDDISCEGTFLVGLSMAFRRRKPPLLLPLMKHPVKSLNHPVQLFSSPINPHVSRLECNVELGQAVASLAYAGAALGWEVRLLGPSSLGLKALKHLMGLTTDSDLENEGPVAALIVFPAPNAGDTDGPSIIDVPAFKEKIIKRFHEGIRWFGCPYVIRHWDNFPESVVLSKSLTERVHRQEDNEFVILDRTPPAMTARDFTYPSSLTLRRALHSRDTATLIYLDDNYTMGFGQFQQFVLRCCAHEDADAPRRRECFPHGVLPWFPRVNVFFYVNRVEGLELGLYCLVRNRSHITSTESPYRWKGSILGHPALESQFYQFRNADDYQADAQRLELEISTVLVVMVTQLDIEHEGYIWEVGILGEMLAVEAQAQGLSASPLYSQYYRHFWQEIFRINREDGEVICVYVIGKKHYWGRRTPV